MQHAQSGVSGFVLACVCNMSSSILMSISISISAVIYVLTSAYEMVLKLQFAEPDVLCLLESLLMCCTVHPCSCAQTRLGLYALQSVCDIALGAGSFGNHGLLH